MSAPKELTRGCTDCRAKGVTDVPLPQLVEESKAQSTYRCPSCRQLHIVHADRLRELADAKGGAQ